MILLVQPMQRVPTMRKLSLTTALFLAILGYAEEIDKKFPLDPQLKVLGEDTKSPNYRELVLKKMLITDLNAEWQRAFTADNADSFLEKNGGKEKVLANPDLKAAYERRLKIREDFLALMREGYQRYKAVAPFDKGEKAEIAGTTSNKASTRGSNLAPSLGIP
ncbi:MAG: hypothetical protein ACO3E9_05440, partial [Gemmataceae bacterium]